MALCVDPASTLSFDSLPRFPASNPFEALLTYQAQADDFQERCSSLQLSLQAQQLDLEQLSRRLALLEQLVSAGSDASQRLQSRLAQALA